MSTESWPRENATLNQGALDERLRNGADRMTQIEHELRDLRRELGEHTAMANRGLRDLSEQMRANTEVTLSIKDIVDTGRALFKLGGWIGSFLKWASGVIAAGAVVWLFLWERRP